MVEIRGFMGKAEGLWEPWGQGQGHGGDKGLGDKGALWDNGGSGRSGLVWEGVVCDKQGNLKGGSEMTRARGAQGWACVDTPRRLKRYSGF
jgi:hypothetical protein